jgi:SAM-dependent methyltransferase
MAEAHPFVLRNHSYKQQQYRLAPTVEAIGQIIYNGPMREDVRTQAWGEATIDLIGDEDNGVELRSILITANELRKQRLKTEGQYTSVKPDYMAQLNYRAVMKQLDTLQIPGYTWPDDYTSELPWKLAICEIVNDPHRQDEFLWDLTGQDINSNISDRYLGFIAAIGLIQLADGRLTNDIWWLDKGASVNHGPKKVALGKPFPNAEYGWRTIDKHGEEQFVVDEEVTAYMAKWALNNHVKIAKAIGLDRLDTVNDPKKKAWIEVCSFWASERTKERIREYHELDNAEPPNVEFLHAYMDDPNITEIPGLGAGSFDVISTFTALYMQGRKAQEDSLTNDFRLLKPDGIALRQEFARVKHGRLHVYSRIHEKDWRYILAVNDMRDPAKRTVPFIEWRSGRARHAQLQEGAIAILADSGDVQSPELLKRAAALKQTSRYR